MKKAKVGAVEPRPADQAVANGDPFAVMGGSRVKAFNSVILRETLAALPARTLPEDATEDDRAAAIVQRERMQQAACAALAGFEPKDEVEGMIAAQAVALHLAAMECMRRAMHPAQSPDGASRAMKDGANMARAMTDMLEALDRKRGKGTQVVRVERVTVESGGQAIVGAVNGAGGQARGEGA